MIEPVFARVTDPIERIFGILDGYRQGLLATELSGTGARSATSRSSSPTATRPRGSSWR